MAGINFCPFDGKAINKKNLAYEIVHPNGWTWDKVKRETVIGMDPRVYISEHDGKRRRFAERVGLLDDSAADNQVMLLANEQKDGKDGLTLLCESLEAGKRKQEKGKSVKILGKQYASYEDYIKRAYKMGSAEVYEEEPEDDFDQKSEDAPAKLRYVHQNNMHIFVDSNKDAVMYALPCCPYCHNRLPSGWLSADDFMGILVLASDEADKEHYIHSVFQQERKKLEHIASELGSHIYIQNVAYSDDMSMGASPIFMNVQSEAGQVKKSIMIGLYVYSNEAIINLNLMQSPWMSVVLDKMYADFFIVGNGDCVSVPTACKKSVFQKCTMLSLEEQAHFQKEHAGQIISALDILNNDYEEDDVSETKLSDEGTQREGVISQLYDKLLRHRLDYDCRKYMQNMHFVGVSYADEIDDYVATMGADYGMGAMWYRVSSEAETDEKNVAVPLVNCILSFIEESGRRILN